MCVPYCIRTVHTPSSILCCLLNHIHLSGKWCLWMCSAYKSTTDEGFSFYLDPCPLSKPFCQVDWEKPGCLCVLAPSTGWNKVHMGFLWASFTGFFLCKTHHRGGVRAEGLMSCLSPTDRDLIKWVPRCLKQPLAINQSIFQSWGSTCISPSGGI